MKKYQIHFKEGDFLLKIEYRFVNCDKSSSNLQKTIFLHNCAYTLLYEMLKDIGISSYKIKKTELGKPYIEGCDVHFSIAHTEGLVCCVIADKECGIDCEKIVKKQNAVSFCKRFFVGGEIEKMEKCGYDDTELLKIWTCKEAYGKKNGQGVALSLSFDTTKENFNTIIEGGYIITVCV